MPVSLTPWMGTVNLINPNQAYALDQLLLAIAANRRPSLRATAPVCQFLSIQCNPDALAAVNFYVGNGDMTVTDYGVKMVAGQSLPIYSMDSNLIRLDHIYLMTDGSNQKFNIMFLTR